MRKRFRLFEPQDVRWGDMDAMGHVNNAVFFTYCESARMRYFEAVGMESHRDDPGRGPALVTATCNFQRQVRYPDRLEVAARVASLSRRSFELEYAVFRRGTSEVVAEGSSVVVWVDYEAGKALPLPEGLRQAIEAFEDGRLKRP